MSKSYTYHKIADSIEEINFSSKGLAEINVAGKHICIAQRNNELFACAAKCPHAGGTLANGYLDASGNITCPLHRYKFSLTTGRNISGEGYFLKLFPVQNREDGVYLGIPDPGIFSWLK